MSQNPEILSEIGEHLSRQSRPSKDILVKSLRQAASVLLELEYSSSHKPLITPFTQSLIKHSLLRHKDKDVKLLVAVCFCELLRLLAPDPPFDDPLFKDIFQLFIHIFTDLPDTDSPYFSRRLRILETVASLECSRHLLHLPSPHLILNIFTTFFSVVRQGHQPSLKNGMLSIMSLILNEQEETPQPILEVILQNLIDKGEVNSPASYHLAVALIQNCEEKLKPAICEFVTFCIVDRECASSDLRECYHQVIFENFQSTPQMLSAIIPKLGEELVTDQADIRIKAVNLIGKLLLLHKDHVFDGHHHLFVELLKRFSDKSADVRISTIRVVKKCYMAKPSGIELHEILSCLEGRLLDLDASVRAAAVSVVCDLSKFSLKSFPETLIARATDRLRDKLTSVRKEALTKLLEVYREYCIKFHESDGHVPFIESFEQIPCKILILSLDNNLKEFRPQHLELLLATDMFPVSLSGKDRMGHWMHLYSLFNPAHVKALNLILCQKKRFQSEMRGYLSLLTKEKCVDVEEVDTRIKNAITRMSATFPSPAKAEECFLKLNQLKDTRRLLPLMQLLDEPSLVKAKILMDQFLKDIGDKHSLFEFLELLCVKCSNNIFSSEHFRHILQHVASSKCRDHTMESSFNLLSDAVRNFPLLVRDSEDQFKMLMLKEDSAACEKLLVILAKLDPSFSIELSQIYPLLERLCLEGTRAQSKAAVTVIAASLGCDNESLLLDLCQKLVESLRAGSNIPTALQSLGCIFHHSGLAFQQHGEEVSSYIREEVLNDKTAEHSGSTDEMSQPYMSSSCKLKIYGLKTLVKSVLSKKGTHGKEQIFDLMELLSKVLLVDEFADGVSACETDLAHMRLAAAKSVIRLSRRWDMHISPQMFHSAIMMAKDASPLIRRAFLDKTYKLLRKHLASRRFACAFALAASDCIKDLQDASFTYLAEFIKEYSITAKACLPSSKEISMTDCPEYIVVFLLHALAHDAKFPLMDSHDEVQFAQFCRPLLLALHVLLTSQCGDGNMNVNKTFLHLRSIFRAIKRAEDAVDSNKSLKLHVLADIGILTLNVIQSDGIDFSLTHGLVLLPSSMYKASATRERTEENCSHQGLVNEEFVRKLVQIFECDFSQVSSSSVNRHQKSLKGRVMDRNVTYSLGSKQGDTLKDLTTQKRIVVKNMGRTRVLEACPKVKKQKNVDGASVIKESHADESHNLGHLDCEHRPSLKSSNLELFETESDISTQDINVPLPVSQEESTMGRSFESAKTQNLCMVKLSHCCSSDGSTVSFLGQRDAKKQCVRDGAEAIVTASGKGAAEPRRLGKGERNILVDKTNTLAVKSMLKTGQQKSCQGERVHLETSASNKNKDGIAHRTRGQRASGKLQ